MTASRKYIQALVALKRIADDISQSLYRPDLRCRPQYYDYVVTTIFAYPELPEFLKNAYLWEHDTVHPACFQILDSLWTSKNPYRIAVLCGGSGALSGALRRHFSSRSLTIDNLDLSKSMLDRDGNSDAKILVDLSLPINLGRTYDCVLCVGGLRYFSTSLHVFADNIRQLIGKAGTMFIAEVDSGLTQELCQLLTHDGIVCHLTKTTLRVFRNTLFYFLLDQYKKNNRFRELVTSLEEPGMDLCRILIDLAGYKMTTFHFCTCTTRMCDEGAGTISKGLEEKHSIRAV